MSLVAIAKRKLVVSEHVEQSFLIQHLALLEKKYPELELLYAVPNAGGFKGGFKSNVRIVQKLKAEGVKSGVPDLVLPVPRWPFHGLYVEMKRIGGKAEPAQQKWQRRLIDQGYAAVTCEGEGSAYLLITRYLALSIGWLPARLLERDELKYLIEGIHGVTHYAPDPATPTTPREK